MGVPANLSALQRSGLLEARHLMSLAGAIRSWERTPAACVAAHANSHPRRPFLIDELGTLTFAEAHAQTSSIAAGLADLGAGPGERIALMARNHRGFILALLAGSKLGCTVVLLNTDFGGPQLAGVMEHEAPRLLIHDAEFGGLLAGVDGSIPRVLCWQDGQEAQAGTPALEQLGASARAVAVAPPPAPGRTIILSAGTTGAPKGVQRAGSTPLRPLFGLLQRLPLRAGDRHVICAPMFHGWGFLHLGLAMLLGCTVVVRRRFDPELALESIADHRAASAPMVPVMLQRIMQLDPHVRGGYDTSSLRAIPLGGSAIPAGLAVRAMDALGDIVYNVYGSTEVAMATLATPSDLRRAPGTAGRPLPGTRVRILDERDRELPAGHTGVVYVDSALASDGYSGGGHKRAVDGLLCSGDLGHLDEAGRLFIDGRADDMIVSGGENVHPGEVEDVLVSHPAILEAAAVGVDDESFGQRLCAYVVCQPGGSISAEEVRAHVKANLARYKVPRDVQFLAALPRNPAGKVVKHELAALSPFTTSAAYLLDASR